MASTEELMNLGLPGALATHFGTDEASAVTAAGSTQATATQLTTLFSEVTTGTSNQGVILPLVGHLAVVYNGTGNTIKVYAPVGGYLNSSQNGSLSVTNGKAALFVRGSTRWVALLGA